jgi:hypothetical protein
MGLPLKPYVPRFFQPRLDRDYIKMWWEVAALVPRHDGKPAPTILSVAKRAWNRANASRAAKAGKKRLGPEWYRGVW